MGIGRVRGGLTRQWATHPWSQRGNLEVHSSQEDPLIVGVLARSRPRNISGHDPGGRPGSLVGHGHRVVVETNAGAGSSITDADYSAVGAEILPDAATVFSTAEMIVKVKEPQPVEIAMLGPKQLACSPISTCVPRGGQGSPRLEVTAIAYETVQLDNGTLPLLAPMSEIAGRMAAQAGAHFLERPRGGRGVLLGGVPRMSPGKVTVLGAGMAGRNAAMIAAGMGALRSPFSTSTSPHCATSMNCAGAMS